ncbi:oxidoreductase [Actinomadura meridiana]|uniref:Oxidoreductase n=1 Tax=Actinomadura meridiana TaxID=559626 RepID=A0ABP8CFG7_9ACTN
MSAIPLPDAVDTLVVGGGLAGLAVAAELDRAGAGDGTAVLESGPDAGAAHNRWAHDEADAQRRWLHPEHDPHTWRPWTTGGPEFAGMAALRRRVGGRSLYWHGILLPIEPWALTGPDWPAEIVHDLVGSWQGGPGLYERVNAELAAWAGPDATGFAAGPILRIGDYTFTEVPKAIRRHPRLPRRWRAYTPLDHWTTDRGHGSPPAPIHPDSHTVGVLLDGDRAVGVRVRRGGTETDVAARRVVLAAGAIENARLAVQALSATGGFTEPALPGLVDKVDQGFVVACAANRLPGEVVSLARRGALLFTPCPDGLRSNLFLNIRLNAAGAVLITVSVMGEQHRAESGRVRCLPTGRWPWQTTVTTPEGPKDRALAQEQQAELHRIWRTLHVHLNLPPRALAFDPGYATPRSAHRLTAFDHIAHDAGPLPYALPRGSQQHDAGTTPLGTLLDGDHQFRDIPGLYVAGPSAFPRTGAANPTLTTLALAKRLAATLAATSASATSASAGALAAV